MSCKPETGVWDTVRVGKTFPHRELGQWGQMRSPVRWLYASGVCSLLMAAVRCSAVGERAQAEAGTDPNRCSSAT